MAHINRALSLAGVVVGVDTHVAAALDSLGRVVGRLEVPTTRTGYSRLLSWSREFDANVAFGVEGTGAYGAGLARFLTAAGCRVAEINRPDRRARRAHGKSDPLDAEAAARSVLAGSDAGLAKADHDRVGMIRTLRVARRSAVKMRTQTINQMKALVVTAPDELRSHLRQLNSSKLVALSANARPGPIGTPTAAAKMALRSLAIRYQGFTAELAALARSPDRRSRSRPHNAQRRGLRCCRRVACGSRRQPRTTSQRCSLCQPVWRLTSSRVLRQDESPPAQSRRRSHRE